MSEEKPNPARADTVTVAEVGGSLALGLIVARRREQGEPDCYILDPIGRRRRGAPRGFRLAVLGVRKGREGELFRAEFNVNDGFDPRNVLAAAMLTYHLGCEPSDALIAATAEMFLEDFGDRPTAVGVWLVDKFLGDLRAMEGRP